MPRRLMYGSDAVATVALTGLFDEILSDVDDGTGVSGAEIAAAVVDAATVEHKPNSRKLVLTFDLSEAAPASAVPQIETVEGRTCPVIVNGAQCLADPGHDLPHVFE